MRSRSPAIEQIRDCLKRIGYTDNRLINEYAVTTSGNNVLQFDLVAFSDESVHDTTTSCISVQWCNDNKEKQKYLDEVKYIATPIMLVPTIKKIEIWNAKTDTPTQVYTLTYDELYPYFQKNRFDFSFEKIVEAKLGARQLSLFDAFGLIEFAENANFRMLGEEFKTALFTGKKVLDSKRIKGESNLRALTSITMHILGAIILSHKLYPNEPVNNIHTLLEKLSHVFKNYFDKSFMYKFGNDTIELVFNSLSKNILYRNINNEILGHFYESTLFGETELDRERIRKEFGIYYTPKVLGDDILNHIPIEFIPENQRVVLDGSCGSGSLLISAYKRLEKLLNINWSSKHKHDYLITNINGFDIDRFAREVARLSLLLYSLPNGNSWNILTRDTLKINNFTKLNYPMIIVGNPPFQELRKGSQKQKAVEFLEKYIEWLKPNGYIGIVLPETLLENNSGKQVRTKLLENFDILEIWSMPETIFKNNWATTIVIAQKREKLNYESYPTKIRIVSRNKSSIKKYFDHKKADIEFFFPDQFIWQKNENCTIRFSPLQDIFNKIALNNKVGNKTLHVQGIQIPLSLDYPYASKEYIKGYSKYLQSASDCFSAFSIDWNRQKGYKFINYEKAGNFEYKGLRLRKDYENIYRQQKILIKLSSPPGSFWRISAAIDRDICYPSHSFYCLAPLDNDITLEELVAVLNSKIINSYIGAFNLKRTLNANNIKSIPLPEFSKKDKDFIITTVRKIELLKKQNQKSNEISNLVNEIEKVVNISFKLNDDEIELLDNYYQKRIGRKDSKYFKDDCNGQSFNYIGEVVSVNIKKKILEVCFVETNGVKSVRITNNLPGWLLRKGACFTADILNDLIKEDIWEIFNVKPLEDSYMNEDELFNYICNNKDDSMEVVFNENATD